ncbi:MAG: alanine--tRNA ligase [Candidatus Omnitrophota bacterium]
MKYLSADEIRDAFLKFFESKHHKVVASDSVVPKNDPTVLFTTAGMQQFKRQFLGYVDDFSRATSSQKCIRTDDLDEVGQTNFHHTFFEMLGNFSFGDYFKKEAIEWAWEFLTRVMEIPADRLWVSVYYDDQEALDIWKNQIGVPEHKIFRLGDKSNFWPSNAKQNGPNGPCGPCSEIFFDYRPEDKSVPKDPDDIRGRFAEIWNLVFTQFNRKDGGELEPLPNKNIDTGMGLERLCAVMQGVESNFQTDLFELIIKAIDEEINLNLLSVKEKRIIADHIRAATFAIADGVIPSNKERGSVVKSLINRSANIVFSLRGPDIGPTVYKLVPVVAGVMKAKYPEILKKVDAISDLIRKTEESFSKVLQDNIPKLKAQAESGKIDAKEGGHLLFVFHATYGLPIETSLPVLERELGLTDEEKKEFRLNYAKEMDAHREKSREGSKMAGDVFVDTDLDLNIPKTKFLGYETLSAKARVQRIFTGQESVLKAQKGDEVRIVIDQTPFYAESGGQVGDNGEIYGIDGRHALLRVTDTQKLDNVFLHSITVEQGEISVGDEVEACVDELARMKIMRNHTATHLLQAALRKVLGEHVQQQGSHVNTERLRFDFTHPKALTAEQKQAVEDLVNQMIAQGQAVRKDEMSIEQARQKGALAFFAEKYGETVRVVHIDGFSTELCGGTHLDNIKDIKLFKIVSEGAIAQGIRRIEAMTSQNAENFLSMLKQRELDALDIQRKKESEKKRAEENFLTLKNELDPLIENAESIKGVKVITHVYKDADIATLRKLSDIAVKKAERSFIIFATASDNNASVVASSSAVLVQTVKVYANDIIKDIAEIINGSGGGKPQMAQAGSKDPSRLSEAIEKAKQTVRQKILNP